MSSDNNNSNKDFVEEVKRLRNTRLGQKDVLPILGNGAKKPPAWFNWTEFRDGKKPRFTDSELETVFSNPEVGRAAKRKRTYYQYSISCVPNSWDTSLTFWLKHLK